LLRHLEAIEVRQLNVEHDDLGAEAIRSSERGRCVFSLADDIKAFCLQERPRECPEASVIVDDQHRETDPEIVAPCLRPSHRG
jgi:hypothetical protein